jgi:hypothetical protein
MYPYSDLSTLGIERFGVVLGISALARLTRNDLLDRPELKIALPDNLIRLIELANDGSEQHSQFLYRVVAEFNEGDLDLSPRDLATNLYTSYRFLSEVHNLLTIAAEDIDEEVAYELEGSFDNERYFTSLSPRRNFVKDYYLRVTSWARKTGGLMIEKTSYFFKRVGHFIVTLQIPDRFDSLVDVKKKHIDRIFSFRGGKGAKWFIGTVSSTAGFIHPLLGIPGLVIAYMDP